MNFDDVCVDKLWCNGCGKKTHFQYLSVVSNNSLCQGAGSVCQNLVLGYHKTCFSWDLQRNGDRLNAKYALSASSASSIWPFYHGRSYCHFCWQQGSNLHQQDKNKQQNKAEWLTFGFDATNIFHPSLSTFLEPWLVWVIQCQYRRINSCQNL